MKAILTVIGSDRVGIMAAVCVALAEQGINILDVSQTVMHGSQADKLDGAQVSADGAIFTMIMLVELNDQDFGETAVKLDELGERERLSVRIQREDIFRAMHRI